MRMKNNDLNNSTKKKFEIISVVGGKNENKNETDKTAMNDTHFQSVTLSFVLLFFHEYSC